MKKTYTFHCDSGHGWLEVPLSDLMNMGLRTSDFSRYSYAHVNARYAPTMYLEEDVDMAVFMLAAKRNGIEVELREAYVDGESPIRSYGSNRDGRSFEMGELRDLMTACENEGVFA